MCSGIFPDTSESENILSKDVLYLCPTPCILALNWTTVWSYRLNFSKKKTEVELWVEESKIKAVELSVDIKVKADEVEAIKHLKFHFKSKLWK